MKHYPAILLLISLVITGCATKGNYQEAFNDTESVTNSSQVIAAAPDVILDSALEVTSKQGFNVENVDPKGRVLTVSKEIRNNEDQEISHTIKSTVTVVPISEQQSRVMLSANQITELHKKSTVWFHLLWVLPIIPYDTEYTTVVTDRGTVKEQEFYSSFFSKLNQSVTLKNQKLAEEKLKKDNDVALIKAQELETLRAIQAKTLEDSLKAAADREAEMAAEEEARAAKLAKKKSRKK